MREVWWNIREVGLVGDLGWGQIKIPARVYIGQCAPKKRPPPVTKAGGYVFEMINFFYTHLPHPLIFKSFFLFLSSLRDVVSTSTQYTQLHVYACIVHSTSTPVYSAIPCKPKLTTYIPLYHVHFPLPRKPKFTTYIFLHHVCPNLLFQKKHFFPKSKPKLTMYIFLYFPPKSITNRG